ncbi:hypothetical protein NDU88_001182 [Pleurodeles waltl]|uniref:Uncharacterized protein n=1 Tax=Pleurodeles waltl TaxID=8319 RepID=A0AAV7U5N7_PLEWA|nr:hypothetical protein NDU88_001182 [Pleurodeles waltl]
MVDGVGGNREAEMVFDAPTVGLSQNNDSYELKENITSDLFVDMEILEARAVGKLLNHLKKDRNTFLVIFRNEWRTPCSSTSSPLAIKYRRQTEAHRLERCDAGLCPCLSWAFHQAQDEGLPLSDLLEDLCCSHCKASGDRTLSPAYGENHEEALAEDSWPEEGEDVGP